MKKVGRKLQSKDFIELRFKAIRSLMQIGLTKTEACKALRIHTQWVYCKLNEFQKKELEDIRFLNMKCTSRKFYKNDNNVIIKEL